MKVELKKKNTLTVAFKSLDDIEKDLLSLVKQRAASVQPKGTIYFDSVGSFRNFMTIQKLEVLALIGKVKPKSVYELSKMLSRAIAPVQKDCQMLRDAGFIIFDKEDGGRGTLTPHLAFEYNCILVKLPDYPYELQFNAVA